MRACFFRRPPAQPEAVRPQLSFRRPTSRPSFVLLSCLAACLGGCASSFQWVKDGFSAQHAEAQYASCQLEAERLRYSSDESDDDRQARIRHEAGLCMKADGWQRVDSSGSLASESASQRSDRQGRAQAVSLGSGRGIDTAKDAAGDTAASPSDPKDEGDDPASGKNQGGGDDEDSSERGSAAGP